MVRNTTANTKQLASALDAALVDRFRKFVASRGETIREHLEMALRRHMANPPPVTPDPPLPPVVPPKAAPKGRRRAR